MPPCTWIAARAFSSGGLAGEQLRGGAGADRVADLRVVEHGGRGVGGAAGEGGPDVHVGEQVLNGLERSDRDAELLALERVAARRLERGVGDAEQHRRAQDRADAGACGRRRCASPTRAPRGSASAAPDGRERIERSERLEARAGPTPAQTNTPSARSTAARRSRRRARRGSDRRCASACSTPPTRRSPLAAPSTHGAASVDHRTGPLDEMRAELLEDDRGLDHAEAEAAVGLGHAAGRRRRARPARATRPGRSAARRARAIRSGANRAAQNRRTVSWSSSCSSSRRKSMRAVSILARWKISRCYIYGRAGMTAQSRRTTSVSDSRVLMERDESTGIARLTLNNPERRNAYDPRDARAARRVPRRARGGRRHQGRAAARQRRRLQHRCRHGQRLLLVRQGRDRPSDGRSRPQRPSQRRRLSVDRKTFDFYHDFLGYPKVIVAEVRGFALGGGFEMALMADISVVARNTMVGMPATRFLGPALGLAAHVLLPARPDARATPAPHRRHHRRGEARAPLDLHRGHGRRRRSRRAPTGGRARWRACPPTAS